MYIFYSSTGQDFCGCSQILDVNKIKFGFLIVLFNQTALELNVCCFCSLLRSVMQQLPMTVALPLVWNDGAHAASCTYTVGSACMRPMSPVREVGRKGCGGGGGAVPVCLSLHLHACSCLQLYVRVCVCVCVFAAPAQYKRGHRKTASFGTILDVPKIVVTGISGDHWASSETGWSLLG